MTATTLARPVTARTTAERAQLLPFALAVGFVMATMASRSNAIAALVTVGAVLVAVGRILVTGRMDRISWAASAYLGWQLLFGMAVGAGPAHASDLGRFVSYDGRVFVAFLPFLAYGTIRTVHADLELLRRLLRWTVVANLALFAGGLLHVVPGVVHKGHYYGFTSSHHVPGLFFGVVAVLLGAAPSSARLVSDRVFALGAVLLVGGSGSRTSAVGLLLAAIYLVWSAPDLRVRVRGVVVVVFGVIVALLLSGRLLSTVEFIGSSDFVGSASTEFSQADQVDTGKQLNSASPGDAALSNVLIRFGVWRAGIDEFTRSPLIGIGSWRLDDGDRTYTGVTGLADVATGGTAIHDGGFGAHNLVLQTLAENGIVGLVLLVGPWSLLVRRFRRISGTVGRAGIAMVVFGAGTTLTSNSLVSPALCFPLLVCAMTIARLSPEPGPPSP